MPLPSDVTEKHREWESFFNQDSVRHKLVVRYLYEHLFLGHLAISDKSRKSYYFRLIRSSTPIGLTANE
ncbi:fatty acid cis/trans isomerase [Kangiella sp.]|uniref:fatty acid cis/trans isomerase n=1 Tax=Kangiella sp. TaxID=1920245 RepID=UPI00199A590C|nr:fatty acid cis/trans isomerase [Kangiella sp.]